MLEIGILDAMYGVLQFRLADIHPALRSAVIGEVRDEI